MYKTSFEITNLYDKINIFFPPIPSNSQHLLLQGRNEALYRQGNRRRRSGHPGGVLLLGPDHPEPHHRGHETHGLLEVHQGDQVHHVWIWTHRDFESDG